MKREIWDGLNADGTKAGADLVRGEPIPNGLYHAVSAALIRHTDGSFLLMRRDPSKDAYPGYFEATAGGSVLKGETPLEGIKRELLEETGIIPIELTFLKTIFAHEKQTIYYTYLGITDCDKSAVTLQEGETVEYRWMYYDDFARFITSDECIASQVHDFGEYYASIGINVK